MCDSPLPAQMIVSALVRALPMLADVVILAAFFFSIFGIACVELFKGQFYNRCGVPDFTNASSVITADGRDTLVVRASLHKPCAAHQSCPDAYLSCYIQQNVSYIVADTGQLCKGPLVADQTWDNTTGNPTVSFSYIGGVSWGYACPWTPSDNPNDPNYPNGMLCVPYGNPDLGGYRNFDNILLSWIQVFQHMALQDW